MKFHELDTMMRPYETSVDHKVLPGIHMVARLDGKGFTKVTKRLNFEKPFDMEFSNLMRYTTHYLMENTGFKFIYGYTQSDEISLLFAADEGTFDRKVRKLNSTLAGHASAAASLKLGLGEPLIFDCRISQLPTIQLIKDYFSWRQTDATRNALIGYCYWTLRKEGLSARKTTSIMNGLGEAAQNEILFQRGINFNNIPIWQKRGIGFYYKPYSKRGWNPQKQEEVFTLRKALVTDGELPMKQEYRDFIENLYV